MSIPLKSLVTLLYHRVFIILTSVPFWTEGVLTEGNGATKRLLYPWMLKLLKLSPLNDERALLVIFFFLTVLFLSPWLARSGGSRRCCSRRGGGGSPR